MNVNPILARELRQRMRGGRVVVMITLFLLVVVGVMLLGYWAGAASNRAEMAFGPDGAMFGPMGGPMIDPGQTARIGTGMFAAATATMFVLLAILVPLVASGAVAGERERNTLIPILVTPIRPLRLALGKLWSTTAFVILLAVASLPILMSPVFFGGVRLGAVVRAVIGLILLALIVGSIGLMASALTRRTLSAAILALVMVAVLLLGTAVASAVAARGFGEGRHPIAARWALLANPAVAFGTLVAENTDTGLLGDLSAAGADPTALRRRAPGADAGGRGDTTWFLVRSGLVLGAIVAGCVGVTAIRLRTPAARDR